MGGHSLSTTISKGKKSIGKGNKTYSHHDHNSHVDRTPSSRAHDEGAAGRALPVAGDRELVLTHLVDDLVPIRQVALQILDQVLQIPDSLQLLVFFSARLVQLSLQELDLPGADAGGDGDLAGLGGGGHHNLTLGLLRVLQGRDLDVLGPVLETDSAETGGIILTGDGKN